MKVLEGLAVTAEYFVVSIKILLILPKLLIFYIQVGTEDEPFEHKAIITLHGHHRSRELPIYGTKVLAVRDGALELHGEISYWYYVP